MRLGALPEEVATETKDRQHVLNTVDAVRHSTTGKLSRCRGKERCQLHDRRPEHSLDPAPGNAVHVFEEADAKMQHMAEQLESFGAALYTEYDATGNGIGDRRGRGGGGGTS